MKVEFSEMQAMMIVDILNMRIAELNIAAVGDRCIYLKSWIEAILDKF
jgi:hypothetical protein